MKNDIGNKTRRRKVALKNLELQLDGHLAYMSRTGRYARTTPFTEDEKQINTKREIRMKKEIEILKKRVGGHTNV